MVQSMFSWRRFFSALGVVVLLLFIFPQGGEAVTLPSGAFIVRPAKAELSLHPGETKVVRFMLANGTPDPLRVSALFEDVAPAKQGQASDEPVRLLQGEEGAYSLKDMLALPKEKFDLLTGKEVEVPVTITVPKDALPGGRYGAVVWSFVPSLPKSESGASVALESRIGSLLYVRVLGEVKEEGKLVAFGLFNNRKTVARPSSEAPLRFQVSYENTGSVHVNPYGRITITPLLGDPVIIGIDPWAVLPGATRMREIDGFTPLLPGYYSARLELNRGYQDLVDIKEVHFFVLPTSGETFAGLVVLLALSFLIRRSLRLSKNFVG